MIFPKFLLSNTTKRDLLLYRIGTIIGILSFISLIFFYECLYNQPFPNIPAVIFVTIIYFTFFITTLAEKNNKYVYFLAIISIYITTLFFINLMIVMNFEYEVVLTLSIAISILANGFKTEKMMNFYLVSMILFSIISILLLSNFSILTLINIFALIVWPMLLYCMSKSKFVDKSEIEKKSKFLQMVFKSIKNPTILIDNKTLKVVDCSESIITVFKSISTKDIIDKTIREINTLYLNNLISEKNLLKIDKQDSEKLEFDLIIDDKKKHFKINSNDFFTNDKSYTLFTILDITSEKNQNNKIYTMAFIDDLTKIDNRRSCIIELKKAVLNYEKTHSMFAVCFIDIDEFKKINDTYGHDCGDILLTILASRFVNSTGKGDIIARIGGDEFMLIIKDLPNKDVINLIAQRIIEKVRKPIKLPKKTVTITISMGISLYPNHGKNYTDLMKHADIALYKSKKCGKDQYTIFDEHVN